jgi:penicillin-binding protein 1A
MTGLAGICCGILAGLFFSLFYDLPQINRLKQFKPSSVTTVYSAGGRILDRFYIEKRFPVSIDQIPLTLLDAVVTVEDRHFFSHSGINIKAIIRAIVKDLQAGRFKEGGSTLTQQLAKTLFLTSEKSVVRKIKELILSIQIERRYTKDEILELYLNQIYFGSGTYGVEAASRTYFNKPVSQIDLPQAALLAGLPKAPSVYSPLNNPQLAKKRRDLVLNQMASTGRISREELQKALAAPVSVEKEEKGDNPSGYFVEYVKSVIQKRFDTREMFSKGLNIHTTLELDLQKSAAQAISLHMGRLETRMKESRLDPSSAQCALVAIDTGTGAIRAMSGGKRFEHSPFNRAVQALRQPGSAFKPFVYAAAVIRGAQQTQVLLDAPLSYHFENDDLWQVNNFSNTYQGEMTFRQALALSKNTPVVRLMEQIGPATVIEFANACGIHSKLNPNLSLALGTSEVTLMELTAAYIPFANMGIRVRPFAIDRITDTDSRLIYAHSPEKQAVLSREHAAVMVDMLKAAILEGTGRKAGVVKQDIAGKTGTTDNCRDALFVGFSPDLVIGVWVGNDDTSSLGRLETGARAALPIWTQVMQDHISGRPAHYFDMPDGLKMVYMNPKTGKTYAQPAPGTVKALVQQEEDHDTKSSP